MPTLALAIAAAAFFRVVMVGVQFLLPLLLQIGFHTTAFAAGLLILFLSAGALAMKPATPFILRQFGFRTVLIADGLICATCVLLFSFFAPATPTALIAAVLLVYGFARSLQFSALNSLAYADTSPTHLSAATSLVSTFQEMGSGAGVAAGAAFLQIAVIVSGDALNGGHIRAVLAVFAAVAVVPVLIAYRLDRQAGGEMSGHNGVAGPSAATKV
jgi:hypothetical protein